MTHGIGTLALATVGLLVSGVPFASEPSAISAATRTCEAQRPNEARATADLLMKQEAYQRAGECYVAAGEYGLANRAFLKAARPAAVATGRAIAGQREAPRALLSQVKSAFHANR